MYRQCVIHQKYRSVANVLWSYLCQGRAYSLAEAINLYESEKRELRKLEILDGMADAQYAANMRMEDYARKTADYAKETRDIARDAYYDDFFRS